MKEKSYEEWKRGNANKELKKNTEKKEGKGKKERRGKRGEMKIGEEDGREK